MDWSPKFKIGDIISNEELYTEFQCGNMGGMRRSHKRNCLVIISDRTKKFYKDKWENGVLLYTGMGKNGDQVLDGNQNRTLYDSNSNGVAVYLFEVINPKEYEFEGQVKLAATPYQTTQGNVDGIARTVWIFPVKPISNFTDEEVAEGLDLAVLMRIAKQRASSNVEQKEVTTKQYSRDSYISVLAKRLAEGKCALCQQPAPFQDKKGNPYLETHHVIWLSHGGADSIDNTVALCPNCHKKMHIVADPNDITTLKGIAKSNALSIGEED